jgi:hypothetical protein
MGYVFENLIRRFNEQANEEAGDHFTPREVIRLMAHLIYTGDEDVYTPGISRTIYEADLDMAFKAAGLKIAAAIYKAIIATLSERDATANICLDPEGNPEADAELRDHESIPLPGGIELSMAADLISMNSDSSGSATTGMPTPIIPFRRPATIRLRADEGRGQPQ